MINSATTDSAMTETTCQNNVALAVLTTLRTVSYTHLTLPTIYSV